MRYRPFWILLAFIFFLSMVGSCDIFSSDISPYDSIEVPNNSTIEQFTGTFWDLEGMQGRKGTRMPIPVNKDFSLKFTTGDFIESSSSERDVDSLLIKSPFHKGIGSGAYYAEDSGYVDIGVSLGGSDGCVSDRFTCLYLERLRKVDRYQVSNNRLKLGYGEKGVIEYVRDR